MTINVILRRRKLGKGSTGGIVAKSTKGLRTIRNWIDPWPQELNLVFRWGCTSTVPAGITVVNSADSIHWCSDKRKGRLDMQSAGVPVPKTWDTNELLLSCEDGSIETEITDAKLVFRPSVHSQGRKLFVGTTRDAYNYVHCWNGEFAQGYAALLIDKVAEYRVFVVQNRVGWVAKKTPGNPDQVAWNVAQGGRFDNVKWGDWPIAVINAALKAAKVSKTDFCGVDVMVDAEGNPYVLEVNSAPSQTSDYRQQCVAKCFDYIIEKGKDHFPDVEVTKWKHAIHPAIWKKDD